jgi:hypothetical protein
MAVRTAQITGNGDYPFSKGYPLRGMHTVAWSNTVATTPGTVDIGTAIFRLIGTHRIEGAVADDEEMEFLVPNSQVDSTLLDDQGNARTMMSIQLCCSRLIVRVASWSTNFYVWLD